MNPKTDYVLTSDGRLMSRKDALDARTHEGGISDKKTPNKETPKLSIHERLWLRDFMASPEALNFINNKKYTVQQQEKRKEILEDKATKELLYLRQVNDEKVKSGGQRLSKEDHHLRLVEGVVLSEYRIKEQRDRNREQIKNNGKGSVSSYE